MVDSLHPRPATTTEEIVDLGRILRARVYDVAIESPLDHAPRLSKRLGREVLLKREDLQPVFSFKLRGAYQKISGLDRERLAAGVVCSSAGNHAQGVALAARRCGTRAVVVMPSSTPTIKVEAVRALGAEIVLTGETYDDAYQAARELEREKGLAFIHPFDDPEVIAGQGTIALEVVRQSSKVPEAVFVPVGGGGLAAGVATAIKSIHPQVRMIGVEPRDAAGMHASLEAGQPVTLDHVGSFADGVAVRRVGDLTFQLCQRYLDEIVLVSTDEICAAIRDIFEDTRSIAEPAGALAVAGMHRWASLQPALDDVTETGPLVALVCGANMNFSRLRHVAERTELGAGREALLAVEIPERPGSFHAFCEAIGQRHVTEFNYRYGDAERAHIFVGVELSGGASERRDLIARLEELGYPTSDLSDDEMAKLHVRYMVGGRGQGVTDERLLRFRFPERRGALLQFLEAIGCSWNISLFHYRNHGSDYGRVLAGLQVPESDLPELERHLETLGYPWWDESENPAYRLFLA